MIDEIVKTIENFDNKATKQYPKIEGFSGLLIQELLNRCVNLIDEDKCYLEVGVNRGKSFCAAALDNNHVSCYGIDNWTTCGDPDREIRLHENMKKYCSWARHFNQDCWEFFKENNDIFGEKVEIYFYDGRHQEDDQYRALVEPQHLLADEAVIFVDDACGFNNRVKKDTERACNDCGELEIINLFDKPRGGEGFWAGLYAIKFERK